MTPYTPEISGRSVLKVVTAVLVIAVLVPFVVFVAPQTVGADGSYIVVSSSMSPTISANDAIIVTDVRPESVEVGDVIVFEERETTAGDDIRVTTHRVVGIDRSDGLQFQTKGDANEDPDSGPVPASALIGRVTFTIPYIGYVVAFASTQLGFLVLVALPLSLLVVGELYDLARAARNTREAKATTTGPNEPFETDGGPDDWGQKDEPK